MKKYKELINICCLRIKGMQMKTMKGHFASITLTKIKNDNNNSQCHLKCRERNVHSPPMYYFGEGTHFSHNPTNKGNPN